jgi:hypothetical protein
MRVYATTLWLPAKGGLPPLFSTIAAWLTGVERRTARRRSPTPGGRPAPAPSSIKPEDILNPGKQILSSGAALEVVTTGDGSPYLHSIKFSHRDAKERWRTWVTEIGIRATAGESELECSIYLYTDEISARASAPIVATRPLIVRELIAKCGATPRTPGLTRPTLVQSNAAELGKVVRAASRVAPLVVASATPSGEYLIDLDRAAELLAGLATLVQIPPFENTRALAETFGDGLTPYGGAVAALFPARPGPYASPIPVARLLPTQIASIREKGKAPEDELLLLVAERMNVPNARRHISPDVVHRERTRRMMARHAHANATREELQGWTVELEAELRRLGDEVARLERESETDAWALGEASDELQVVKEQLHQERSTTTALTSQLASLKNSREGQDETELIRTREAFSRACSGAPTPEDCLSLIQALYPDRVRILDNAFATARAASGFRDGPRVLELLMTLVGAYWQQLHDGRPDAEARKAFPTKRFAAKEANLSAAGVEARTFAYKNARVLMEAHLKAGNTGGSRDTTLRVHFHWDSDDSVIVIGHCGEHISF